MDGTNRDNIKLGLRVAIVQKQDRGIKVRLETGEIGRVYHIK